MKVHATLLRSSACAAPAALPPVSTTTAATCSLVTVVAAASSPFCCSVCSVGVDTPQRLAEHLAGARHSRNAARLRASAACLTPSVLAADSSAAAAHTTTPPLHTHDALTAALHTTAPRPATSSSLFTPPTNLVDRSSSSVAGVPHSSLLPFSSAAARGAGNPSDAQIHAAAHSPLPHLSSNNHQALETRSKVTLKQHRKDRSQNDASKLVGGGKNKKQVARLPPQQQQLHPIVSLGATAACSSVEHAADDARHPRNAARLTAIAGVAPLHALPAADSSPAASILRAALSPRVVTQCTAAAEEVAAATPRSSAPGAASITPELSAMYDAALSKHLDRCMTFPLSASNSIHCAICDKACHSQHEYIAHCTGAPHRASLLTFQRGMMEANGLFAELTGRVLLSELPEHAALTPQHTLQMPLTPEEVAALSPIQQMQLSIYNQPAVAARLRALRQKTSATEWRMYVSALQGGIRTIRHYSQRLCYRPSVKHQLRAAHHPEEAAALDSAALAAGGGVFPEGGERDWDENERDMFIQQEDSSEFAARLNAELEADRLMRSFSHTNRLQEEQAEEQRRAELESSYSSNSASSSSSSSSSSNSNARQSGAAAELNSMPAAEESAQSLDYYAECDDSYDDGGGGDW